MNSQPQSSQLSARLNIQKVDHIAFLQGDLRHQEVALLYKLPQFGVPDGIDIIDLEGLKDIDSAGLALLLEWWRNFKSRESTLCFRNTKPEFLKLLALYDLGFLVE
jgi:ABC-type transporter Mla MlaB component